MKSFLRNAVFCFVVLCIDSTFCAVVTASEWSRENEENKMHKSVPCNREFCRDEDNQVCTDDGCVCKDGYRMDPMQGYVCVVKTNCDKLECDYSTTLCDEDNPACNCKEGYKPIDGEYKKCQISDHCEELQCDEVSTHCDEAEPACICKIGFKPIDEDNKKCQKKNCQFDSECGVNEDCRYEMCQCWYNYTRREDGRCTANECPFEIDCDTETEECRNGKCECKNGFVRNEYGACIEKKCPEDFRCDHYTEECRDGKCECVDFHKRNNHGDCVDVCKLHSCMNGACERRESSYVCRCYDGYTGQFCDKSKVVKENKTDNDNIWLILILSANVLILVLLIGSAFYICRKKSSLIV